MKLINSHSSSTSNTLMGNNTLWDLIKYDCICVLPAIEADIICVINQHPPFQRMNIRIIRSGISFWTRNFVQWIHKWLRQMVNSWDDSGPLCRSLALSWCHAQRWNNAWPFAKIGFGDALSKCSRSLSWFELGERFTTRKGRISDTICSNSNIRSSSKVKGWILK